MSPTKRTNPQGWVAKAPRNQGPAPAPGVLLIFTAGRPRFAAIPLFGGKLEIGRGEIGSIVLTDGCVSRRHARVECAADTWIIEDLDSRNGTFVEGVRLTGEKRGRKPRVVRFGDSVFVPVEDVRPYLGETVQRTEDTIRGPLLERVWQSIARAAHDDESVHFVGESGSGKELAAQAFHRLGPRSKGPFVAVNCASIQPTVAERLLFGTRRGAYSGAVESDGFLQAAHGGTLFLDEIAELELPVQAKLLRTIETGEVLPLGANTPRMVDVRICSATHRKLRSEVAAKRFRGDLYYRVGRPEVVLPPLRERAEEIPWLIELAVDPALPATPAFVEECLLRPWPGNVRELLTEVRAAAREAQSLGAPRIGAEHLSVSAGIELTASSRREASVRQPTDDEIESALRREKGNISAAARALGLHRNQLRRWIAKHKPQGILDTDSSR